MFKIEQKEIIKNEGGGEEIGDCWMMVFDWYTDDCSKSRAWIISIFVHFLMVGF